MAIRKSVYVQYYCANCGGRVVPFSRFERRTLAPVKLAGVGKSVLLLSFLGRKDQQRYAWCFSRTCRRFQEAKRLTSVDINRMYVERGGVGMRRIGGK